MDMKKIITDNKKFIAVATLLLLAMIFNIICNFKEETSITLYVLSLLCTAIPIIMIISWLNWRLNSLAGLGLIIILSGYAISTGVLFVAESIFDKEPTNVSELIDYASMFAYYYSSTILLVVILGIITPIGALFIAKHLWSESKKENNSTFKFLAAGSLLLAILYGVELVQIINFDSIKDFDSIATNTMSTLSDILTYALLIGLAAVGTKASNNTTISAPSIYKPLIGVALITIVGIIGGLGFMKLFEAPWFVQLMILFLTGAIIYLIAYIFKGFAKVKNLAEKV